MWVGDACVSEAKTNDPSAGHRPVEAVLLAFGSPPSRIHIDLVGVLAEDDEESDWLDNPTRPGLGAFKDAWVRQRAGCTGETHVGPPRGGCLVESASIPARNPRCRDHPSGPWHRHPG